MVRARAPTSAKAGDKAILTERGEWLGWVGGSCAEPAARRAAEQALSDGRSRLLHLTNDELEARRPGVEVLAMSCYSGGSLELYVEPHLPEPSLVVFGASPIARALGELGLAMRYRVTCVDAQETAAALRSAAAVPPCCGVREIAELPEPGPATYVVVASHGSGEAEALAWALSRATAYVGLVTSRRRLSEVQEKLAERGLSREQIARVRAPAGLAIEARSAEEVALSVLAQIVAERRGASAGVAAEPAVAAAPSLEPPRAAAPETAAVASCCSREAPRAARSAPPSTFSAVILAAGLSRRMGEPNKLLLPVAGEPMIRRVVATVLAAGVEQAVVVTGHEAEQVQAALAPLAVRMIFNPRFASGQVSSVRAGLEALSEPTDAVLMCLGDQPLLTVEDLRALEAAYARRPRGSVVVPMWGGQRGNPVVLSWASARETLGRASSFGCRHFMAENAEQVYAWPAPNDHFVRDVDQPAEYEELLRAEPA